MKIAEDNSNNADIIAYHNKQAKSDKDICERLYTLITSNLHQAEGKVWHAHPVWFINGNPIVGYSRLKNDLRLMFWSGQSFDEPGLLAEGSFQAATIKYTDVKQIDPEEIKRYLQKSQKIQWDYKNIIKNRELKKLSSF